MGNSRMKIAPFTIRIADAALADLRDRLARTRWPDELNDADWGWGTLSGSLRRLVEYWGSGFDWRVQEAALNQLPQFRAELDGLNIHFVHVRGTGEKPFPLVITHRGPARSSRCAGLPLTDPAAHGGDLADAFDVSCHRCRYGSPIGRPSPACRRRRSRIYGRG